MEIDDDIIIPIYAIHHDPKYHPEPNCFNPERFSSENKHLMHQASFIPFGIGPRTCIGNEKIRFAKSGLRFQCIIFQTLLPFYQKKSIIAKTV